VKRGIVNPNLLEERSKLTFDQDELQKFTLGDFLTKKLQELKDFKEQNPELKPSFAEYEMTREELFEDYWKKNKIFFEKGWDQYFGMLPETMGRGFTFSALDQGCNPWTLQLSMFLFSLLFMCSEE
jgi:hypothetical protein